MLQNLLRSANTYITSPQQQLQKGPQNKIVEDPAVIEAKVKQIETILKSAEQMGTNHTTNSPQGQQLNIIHGNALPQQFAIIGSTKSQQNRIYLTSTQQPSSTSTSSDTGNLTALRVQQGGGIYSTVAISQQQQQPGQVTTLTTIPSTIIMDGKNTDPKLQQHVKLDNRILYTANIKNNRGPVQLTQLNPKLVNIVPISAHAKNNIISTTTGVSGHSQGISVVSASPLGITKSGHMIQRVATINNSQNIRANNTGTAGSNGGNKVLGVVTTTPTATIIGGGGVDTTNNLHKIIQTNDNNSVSGININTSNR